MSSPERTGQAYRKSVLASIVMSGLVLISTASQADTALPVSGSESGGNRATDTEVSFWVGAAPLALVIRQLAILSNRDVEIEDPPEIEELATSEELADAEAAAAVVAAAITDFDEALVTGRFSGSLGSTLERLSADYPVTFDLDGKTLRAMKGATRSNVSIAMLSTTLDEAVKSELVASSEAGNSVDFREDAVRVSGHPTFVKRQSGYITKALASAEARLNAESAATTTESADATSVADSGSAQVLADIQDEGKPPAEQANLSKPIRWVTDIPGYNTF